MNACPRCGRSLVGLREDHVIHCMFTQNGAFPVPGDAVLFSDEELRLLVADPPVAPEAASVESERPVAPESEAHPPRTRRPFHVKTSSPAGDDKKKPAPDDDEADFPLAASTRWVRRPTLQLVE